MGPMPTIRVDQDVFEGLQTLAKPFVDSPSMVIRRLLADRGVLAKNAQAVPPKSAAGIAPHALTPQAVYEKYLLYLLARCYEKKHRKLELEHLK